MKTITTRTCLLLVLALPREDLRAEDGYDCWLRYRPIGDAAERAHCLAHATAIVVPGSSPTLDAARLELKAGLDGLLAQSTAVADSVGRDGAIVCGTPQSLSLVAQLGLEQLLTAAGPEGYLIRSEVVGGRNLTLLVASREVGVLYGVFHFLRLLQTRSSLARLAISESPRIHRRLLNHWDSLERDGVKGWIERGYAGRSLWNWDELPHAVDSRYRDYARANASIGINGAVLNNVNADPRILRADYLEKVAVLARVLRPYGIRVYLAVTFAAPLPPAARPAWERWGGIGNLGTTDPLDPDVRRWWEQKIDEIYRLVPDFGGFLVKARSEGLTAPQQQGRTHTDGANLLGELLAPHGGVVMWRTFVRPIESEPDRAKHVYLEYTPLDGKFASNVFVQPKAGPQDFYPREAPNPLFGAMPRTPLMAEVQITQKFLGQATHLVYLAPQWKEFLEFDTAARGEPSPIGNIIDGTIDGHMLTGIAGVANIGSDRNWCGQDFAQANWYAFGRLAWNHGLTADTIAEEWTRQTWTNAPAAVARIMAMMRGSYQAAVNARSPLALGPTAEAGNYFDPAPDQWAGIGWGVDEKSIGTNRTTTGSDAVSQYHPHARNRWNDLAACPEDYLLWFHRVPWDRKMKSGRPLWEEFCFLFDDGLAYARQMNRDWRTLEDQIDPQRFSAVAAKLTAQEAQMQRWRDHCLSFFAHRSLRRIPAPQSAR